MTANLLDNGDFDGNLDEWSGTGAIARNLGYPRLGCVELEAGESISQEEGLTADQLYTLHFFYRPASGATLTAGYGSITQTFGITAADQWHEGVLAFALNASASDNVAFSAAGGTIYVDSVALLIGGLPISRADIAAKIAADISELATDASLSTTVSASGPEGDYSQAIDEALRQLGAINRHGDADITQLAARRINDALEATKRAMYQRLQSKYALQVDVSLGPRRESLSQKARALGDMTRGGAGDQRITSAPLTHGKWRR